MIIRLIILACVVSMFSGCVSAGDHLTDIRKEPSNLTVGKVQREIKIGMSSAQVVEVLGSPNIVTTDAERNETWIYDKVSTETVYSASATGGSILILGSSVASGAKSTSQKTLTIIIKFDDKNTVKDFKYHASQF